MSYIQLCSFQRNMQTPMQLTLKVQEPEILINEDGVVAIILRNWLPFAQNLHDRLAQQLPWIQGQMNMFGNVIQIPRAMFFLGDDHVKTYTYSRMSFPVQPWNQPGNFLGAEIESIRNKIRTDPILQKLLGIQLQYDSCLLNFYRNGDDKIDFHSDKEALGPMNAVITVSLGASRTFVFKNKVKSSNGRYPTIKTILNNGDLVLMAGRCQELWTHGIPREEAGGSRISLTYRLIN